MHCSIESLPTLWNNLKTGLVLMQSFINIYKYFIKEYYMLNNSACNNVIMHVFLEWRLGVMDIQCDL